MPLFNTASITPSSIFDINGGLVFLPPGIPTSSFNFVSSSDLAALAEETGSLIISYDTASSAVQFRVPATSSGEDEDIIALHITSSGKNARIGVGTTSPLTSFDFKDVEESSTGTELLLRSSRTGSGAQVGDSAGKIIFTIDSASFVNIKKSGSVAEIDTTVDDIDEYGVRGSLNFKVAPVKSSAPVDMLTLKDSYLHELTGSLDMGAGGTSILSSSVLHVSSSDQSFINRLTVGGNVPLTGFQRFYIAGDSIFTGDVKLGNQSSDEITIEGQTIITGSTDITGSLTASGGVNILGGLEVGPTLQFQTQSTPPTAVAGALYVDSNNNLYIGQ